MLRPRAETMPAETEPPRPNGLPIAITQSPGRILSESPKGTAFSGRSAVGFTRSRARSIFESLPMISAFSLVPSLRMTWMSLASPMTWLFVTTMPEASMMKPEPSEFDLRVGPRGLSSSPFGTPWPRRLKNSSKRSSKGVPCGSCGMVRPPRLLASTVVEAEMFTTASVTLSARSASDSGPRAKAGSGRAVTVTVTPSTAAARADEARRANDGVRPRTAFAASLMDGSSSSKSACFRPTYRFSGRHPDQGCRPRWSYRSQIAQRAVPEAVGSASLRAPCGRRPCGSLKKRKKSEFGLTTSRVSCPFSACS